MNKSSIKSILHQDTLEIVINKGSYLIKIGLLICISISILLLLTIIVNSRLLHYDSDSLSDMIAIIIVYIGFYSFLYGTIPATLLIIVIKLYYSYTKKSISNFLKINITFLIINISLILVAATIMTILHFIRIKPI